MPVADEDHRRAVGGAGKQALDERRVGFDLRRAAAEEAVPGRRDGVEARVRERGPGEQCVSAIVDDKARYAEVGDGDVVAGRRGRWFELVLERDERPAGSEREG